MKEVDIIIPTYKPDKSFFALIEKLQKQTVPVGKIIIMNTEQKYFDRLVFGTSFFERYHNVFVTHISKKEFNHGATRNRGVKKSEASVFVLMTQDAVPKDEYLIENLIKPLEKGTVAVAYGRQLPAAGCREIERYTREFNYPADSREKSLKDLGKLGIKTYFCSNVCAAYRRDIFDRQGGFIRHAIFNEDMIYAANVVKAGYSIAYCGDAQVIHSHNYTCLQQFHRNFDLGVSQAEHPEVFAEVPSESEGIQLLKKTTAHLWKTKNKRLIPLLYINSTFKYMGFFLGKHYKRLPAALVMKWTMNKSYWEQDIRIKSSAGIDPSKGYGKTDEENVK